MRRRFFVTADRDRILPGGLDRWALTGIGVIGYGFVSLPVIGNSTQSSTENFGPALARCTLLRTLQNRAGKDEPNREKPPRKIELRHRDNKYNEDSNENDRTFPRKTHSASIRETT